jgi:hypothetical protein
MFNESNIGGHDYLRNLVHLPFYLQNAGLRKVKSAQQAALNAKNSRGVVATTNSNAAVLNWLESDENPSSHNAVSRKEEWRASMILASHCSHSFFHLCDER